MTTSAQDNGSKSTDKARQDATKNIDHAVQVTFSALDEVRESLEAATASFDNETFSEHDKIDLQNTISSIENSWAYAHRILTETDFTKDNIATLVHVRDMCTRAEAKSGLSWS